MVADLRLKRILLKGASGHLTTAEEHIKYLKTLGIPSKEIYKYPFTSVSNNDIADADVMTSKGRAYFKQKLGISEKMMVLSVGRFSYENGYGKGYDILMRLAECVDSSIGIYIVGDEPTSEFVDWKRNKKLGNVHFVGFKCKDELAEFYAAADLFAIFSRGDVWGLVVNEAMTYGLPIISTKQCIAGTELVKDDENGYVVDVNDLKTIKKCFIELLYDNAKLNAFGKCSYLKIKKFTFEQMVEAHINVFENV